MSIKGKKREIPPYYRLLGQAELPLGAEDPHRYVTPVARQGRNPQAQEVLDHLVEGSWLLSTESPFIPFNLLTYGMPNVGPLTNARSAVRNIAYEALEELERKGRAKPGTAVHKYEQYATRQMAKWNDFKLGALLLEYGFQSKPSDERPTRDMVRSSVQSYLNHTPRFMVLRGQRNSNIGAQYQSQRNFLQYRFEEVQSAPTYFVQRTYRGYPDHLTYFWAEGNYGQQPLHPGILAVVTPENWVYQKLHWLLHGTFDMDRVIILVDRELDNPRTEYPRPVRDLYMEFLQKPLLKYKNVWKVPRFFLEQQCLVSPAAFEHKRKGSLLQFKAECVDLLKKWYSSQLLSMWDPSLVNPFLSGESQALLDLVRPWEPERAAIQEATVVVNSVSAEDVELRNSDEEDENFDTDSDWDDDYDDHEYDSPDEDDQEEGSGSEEDSEAHIRAADALQVDEEGVYDEQAGERDGWGTSPVPPPPSAGANMGHWQPNSANMVVDQYGNPVGGQSQYVAGIDPYHPEFDTQRLNDQVGISTQRLGEGLYQQLQNAPVAEYPGSAAISEAEIARQLDLIAQHGRPPGPNGEREEPIIPDAGLLDHLDNLPVE